MIYDDGTFFMAMLNHQRVSIYDSLIKNHGSLPKSHRIQLVAKESGGKFTMGTIRLVPDTPKTMGVLKGFFKDRQQQRFNDFHHGKSRKMTCEF